MISQEHLGSLGTLGTLGTRQSGNRSIGSHTLNCDMLPLAITMDVDTEAPLHVLVDSAQVEMFLSSPRTPRRIVSCEKMEKSQDTLTTMPAEHETDEETVSENDNSCGAVEEVALPTPPPPPRSSSNGFVRCGMDCACGGRGWVGTMPGTSRVVHYDPHCPCLRKFHPYPTNAYGYRGCGDKVEREADRVLELNISEPFEPCFEAKCACGGNGWVSTAVIQPLWYLKRPKSQHDSFRLHVWSKCLCEMKIHLVPTKMDTAAHCFNTRALHDCERLGGRMNRNRKRVKS